MREGADPSQERPLSTAANSNLWLRVCSLPWSTRTALPRSCESCDCDFAPDRTSGQGGNWLRKIRSTGEPGNPLFGHFEQICEFGHSNQVWSIRFRYATVQVLHGHRLNAGHTRRLLQGRHQEVYPLLDGILSIS